MKILVYKSIFKTNWQIGKLANWVCFFLIFFSKTVKKKIHLDCAKTTTFRIYEISLNASTWFLGQNSKFNWWHQITQYSLCFMKTKTKQKNYAAVWYRGDLPLCPFFNIFVVKAYCTMKCNKVQCTLLAWDLLAQHYHLLSKHYHLLLHILLPTVLITTICCNKYYHLLNQTLQFGVANITICCIKHYCPCLFWALLSNNCLQ